jgi:hypothetical protein
VLTHCTAHLPQLKCHTATTHPATHLPLLSFAVAVDASRAKTFPQQAAQSALTSLGQDQAWSIACKSGVLLPHVLARAMYTHTHTHTHVHSLTHSITRTHARARECHCVAHDKRCACTCLQLSLQIHFINVALARGMMKLQHTSDSCGW